MRAHCGRDAFREEGRSHLPLCQPLLGLLFVICIYAPTNAEKLVKFGLVRAEIFGMICRFLPFAAKGTETPCVIFGISGPIFTKIAQNVAKIVPFITPKSELQYSNPL